MLRTPNPELGSSADEATAPAPIADVLRTASTAAYGRLAADVVDPSRMPGWVRLADLQRRPDVLAELAERVGEDRFCSPDRALALAQVAREAIAVVVTVATRTWGCQRRLLDLGVDNIALHDGPSAVIAGLRRPRLAVLADDPLAGHRDVEVLDEATMVSRLLEDVLGHPIGGTDSSTEPTGSVATIVATARRLRTMGERHLWGTAALAVAGALTEASHVVGSRADDDRARLFAQRPDLARLIDLVTVADTTGQPLTFAVRRTCCLLYKIPPGTQCATCSLRDPEDQVTELTAWHLHRRSSTG